MKVVPEPGIANSGGTDEAVTEKDSRPFTPEIHDETRAHASGRNSVDSNSGYVTMTQNVAWFERVKLRMIWFKIRFSGPWVTGEPERHGCRRFFACSD